LEDYGNELLLVLYSLRRKALNRSIRSGCSQVPVCPNRSSHLRALLGLDCFTCNRGFFI